MENVNSIYFPLRSNIGWFQSDKLQQSIVNRIKIALLIYDVIIFEEGTYIAEFTENGGPEWFWPPGFFPVDQRFIDYDRDIKPGNISVGISIANSEKFTEINSGKTIERFKIDYYQILNQIDLSKYDFIRYINIKNKSNFPKETQKIIRTLNHRDKTTLKDSHANTFMRDSFIQNLNLDLVTSILLQSSIIFDHNHTKLLNKKSISSQREISSFPDGKDFAAKSLLSFVTPNIEDLTIDQILDLRMDKTWVDFRDFINSIILEVKSDPDNLYDKEKYLSYIESYLKNKMFDKLKRKHKTGLSLTFDIASGIVSNIPVVGAILKAGETVNTIDSYLADKSSWFAFLMKIDKYN